MINQVFKVIKGRKLRAMLTSGLRDLDTKELKSLCLTQLEGMSKRRIKYILAGREMDESSATDDSEEEDDDEQLEQDDQGMASGPLVDDIQTSLLNRKTPDDEAKEEPIGNVQLLDSRHFRILNAKKIMKKIVKLCLHLSFIMQNSFHFDENFSWKIL